MNRVNSKGKRFDGEPKLNIKKVVATLLAVVAVIMVIVSIKNALKKEIKTKSLSVETAYFTVFSNNKWGVIDNEGNSVIAPEYDEMIIIPNKNEDIFICTYNVDYNNSTYNTKVLDANNKEKFSQYNKIEPIENFEGNNIWYENNVLKYEKDGKYGLINFEGKEILPPEYDAVYALNGIEKSIIIEQNGKKGLVNNTLGEIIIEAQYDEISSLTETYDNGYIVKNSEGKFGVIGADKKVVLEPKYDEISHVCGNEMYVVTETGVYKIIKQNGDTVLDSDFGKVVSINGENIVIEKDGKQGIINGLGEVKVNPEYESLQYAFENNFIAKKDGKFGIITNTNEVKVDFKYTTMSYLKKANFIQADDEQYRTEILDSNFNTVLSDVIISEINTEKGYLRIRQGSEYKYYNFKFEEKKPKEILATRTLFLVKENGKYGYENEKGNRIVDCIYDDAMEQNEYGYCAVKKDGVWGALKANGSVVLEPKVDLENCLYIDFIGEWHLDKDLSLNIYTK